MLLMDRLFRKRGLNTARIGPLERLTYIGSNAMGAMSYKPVSPDVTSVQEVLKGEEGSSSTDSYLWEGHHRDLAQKLCCIVTL